MNPDRLIGLAYACNLFHNGQWSKEYRLMCKINWQPKGQAEYLLPRNEFECARQYAAHYIKYFRNK